MKYMYSNMVQDIIDREKCACVWQSDQYPRIWHQVRQSQVLILKGRKSSWVGVLQSNDHLPAYHLSHDWPVCFHSTTDGGMDGAQQLISGNLRVEKFVNTTVKLHKELNSLDFYFLVSASKFHQKISALKVLDEFTQWFHMEQSAEWIYQATWGHLTLYDG